MVLLIVISDNGGNCNKYEQESKWQFNEMIECLHGDLVHIVWGAASSHMIAGEC